MRDTKKRIVKASQEKALKAMFQHVSRMLKKGWLPSSTLIGGNAGCKYEHIVHFSKPKNEHERDILLDSIQQNGWRIKGSECLGWSWGEGFFE